MSTKSLAPLSFFVIALCLTACGDKIRLANGPTHYDSLGLVAKNAKSTRALESLKATTTWIGRCASQSAPGTLTPARLTMERTASGFWIDANENGFSTTLSYSESSDAFEGKSADGLRAVTLKSGEVAPQATAIFVSLANNAGVTRCYFGETKNERATNEASAVEKAIEKLLPKS